MHMSIILTTNTISIGPMTNKTAATIKKPPSHLDMLNCHRSGGSSSGGPAGAALAAALA